MRRSSPPRRDLSSSSSASPEDWRRQSSNIRVGGPPSPIFTKDEGACGCTSGIFSMFFWGTSRPAKTSENTTSEDEEEEEVRSSFASVFSSYSTICGSEQGMTYDQAVSRPPARDVHFWYESVAAMNDEDEEEECALVAPPSLIKGYAFEDEEDVAVLENAVMQLKLEVEKLEKKKKKRKKSTNDNKENLSSPLAAAPAAVERTPAKKDREVANAHPRQEHSAVL